mmetsp:Transcript_3327/g.11687  ORF Transcript_3327/g.11687 Transcript_3327/m.11687 type:complete len:211 (+) Transcript_3327:1580-2212(+)
MSTLTASSMAIFSMMRAYMAIQAVPSACSRNPPVGRGSLRSKRPMLSRPRKPPPKRCLPVLSVLFTHQVKLMTSFWKQRESQRACLRQPSSELAERLRPILYTRQQAHACTGGLTSLRFHSYAGRQPLGCMYHSRSCSRSCSCARWRSMSATATAWKARSHTAGQGYSQVSGTRSTSRAYMCDQSPLRRSFREAGGGGKEASPASQSWTM